MGWPDLLATLEADLAAYEQAFRGEGEPPPAFEVPENLGPLPEDLRERAAEVLRRTLAVEAEVSLRLDLARHALVSRAEGAGASRASGSRDRAALFVDKLA